jgi:hypothetical protein
MTAEERNRKMKHGHIVPRSWIPEFNLTHRRQSDFEKRGNQGAASTSNETIRKTHYKLRRQARMALKRQNTRKAIQDLRVLQQAAAALLALVGFLAGGSIGLAAGLLIGLLIVSFRIEQRRD